jgi:hypothetical protein
MPILRTPSGPMHCTRATGAGMIGAQVKQVKRAKPDLKYRLRIDLSCFDGQPSCPRGGPSDQTERCESAPAVPVEGSAAAHGPAVRTALWLKSGRAPIWRHCADDPTLAGPVARGSAAGPRAAIPEAPWPTDQPPSPGAHWPGATRARVRRPAHATVASPRSRRPGRRGHDSTSIP